MSQLDDLAKQLSAAETENSNLRHQLQVAVHSRMLGFYERVFAAAISAGHDVAKAHAIAAQALTLYPNVIELEISREISREPGDALPPAIHLPDDRTLGRIASSAVYGSDGVDDVAHAMIGASIRARLARQ